MDAREKIKKLKKVYDKGDLGESWVENKNGGLKIAAILARWTY